MKHQNNFGIDSLFNLEKGGFKRNFLSVFSSKVSVAILSFLVTPILSRIYSPADYGVFAIFTTISNNFLVLSCLSYDNALIMISDERDFLSLQRLCLFTFCCLMVPLFIFSPDIINLLDSENSIQNSSLPMLIFAGVSIAAFTNILQKYSFMYNQLGFASRVSITTQVSTRSSAILFGQFPLLLNFGLIMSDMVGKTTFMAGLLFKYWSKFKEIFTQFSYREIRHVAKKYWKYPSFILPSKYINILANQVAIIVISRFYELSDLGNFSMATALVLLPINLLGNSISNIYTSRFKESSDQEVAVLTNRLIALIFVILIPPVILLVFYSKEFLVFFLGQDWSIAGEISELLCLFIIHETIFIMISGVFQIKKMERSLLFFQAIRLLVLLGFVYLAIEFDFSFLELVFGFSVVRLLLYTVIVDYVLKGVGQISRISNALIALALLSIYYFLKYPIN